MSARKLKPKLFTNKDGSLAVWSEEVGGDYRGPTAQITWDKDWLHIVTDDYEGNAMVNIETLPALRRALARVAKDSATKSRGRLQSDTK
jgi:hypothetical protein